MLEDRKHAAGQGSAQATVLRGARLRLSEMGGTGASMSGDLSAIFKDTSLSSQRPDFQSFLKKGDERLKLLEQADRMPDLQSDFTTQPVQDGVPQVQGAVGRAPARSDLAAEAARAPRGDGAARSQGRRQLGRRRRRRAWRRSRAASATGPWRRCSRRSTRCARRTRPAAPARASRADASRAGRGTAAIVAAVRAGVRRTRTSARARGCCPARAAAARPKGEATQRLRSNAVRRGRGGRVAARAQGRVRHQPDRAGRQRRPRGCSTSVSSGSIAR